MGFWSTVNSRKELENGVCWIYKLENCWDFIPSQSNIKEKRCLFVLSVGDTACFVTCVGVQCAARQEWGHRGLEQSPFCRPRLLFKWNSSDSFYALWQGDQFKVEEEAGSWSQQCLESGLCEHVITPVSWALTGTHGRILCAIKKNFIPFCLVPYHFCRWLILPPCGLCCKSVLSGNKNLGRNPKLTMNCKIHQINKM